VVANGLRSKGLLLDLHVRSQDGQRPTGLRHHLGADAIAGQADDLHAGAAAARAGTLST